MGVHTACNKLVIITEPETFFYLTKDADNDLKH